MTRDKVREIVFECSIVYANALLRGVSIQEAEMIRIERFNDFWPESET